MKKRVVSWLLVVLMLTSLLPTSVLAEMAEGAAQTPAAEEVLPEAPESPEEPEQPEGAAQASAAEEVLPEAPESPEEPEQPETPEEPENTEDAGQETGPLAAVQSAGVAVQAGVTEISSAEEFAEMDKAGSYKLTEDITITAPYSKGAFTGTFDGNGKTITLKLNTTSGNTGLFAKVMSGAEIKNLTVKANVSSSTGGNYGTAGLIGEVGSGGVVLEKCGVTGEIVSTQASKAVYVGGLIGYVTGGPVTMTECYSTASVTSSSTHYAPATGGMVGKFYSAGALTATDCYCTGDVAAKKYASGFIGGLNSSSSAAHTYINCYAAGTVTGKNAYGFAFISSSTGYTFTNCYYNNANASGCNKSDTAAKAITGKSSEELKGLAETLGGAFKADTGINGGYPILTWQGGSSSGGETVTTGSVTITVEPKDAVLTWNDEVQTVSGSGSYTFPELNPGEYDYMVTPAEGTDYQPASGTVAVAAGDSKTLSVTLERNKHTLTFTRPAEAEDWALTVTDKSSGKAVSANADGGYAVRGGGTYAYTVTVPWGYKEIKGEVTVGTTDQTVTIAAEKLPAWTVKFVCVEGVDASITVKYQGSSSVPANADGSYTLPLGRDYTWTVKDKSGKYIEQAGIVALTKETTEKAETISVPAVEAPKGKGTAEEPYQIGDAAQLVWFAGQVNSNAAVCAKLTNDIDLSGRAWTPISSYAGTFDGQGHTIRNMAVTGSAAANYGLFAQLNGGTICDVTVSGTVTATSNNAYYGTGGIVGKVLNGTVERCASDVTVNGNYNTAGVVGLMSSGVISQCVSRGNISGSNNVGGIVGKISGAGRVENCYARGRVSAYSQGGGIAGYLESSSAKVADCYAVSTITKLNTTGEFGAVTGKVKSGTVENCCYLAGENVPADKSGAQGLDSSALKLAVLSLGDAFRADSKKINDGYPVLAWQVPGQTAAEPVYAENVEFKQEQVQLTSSSAVESEEAYGLLSSSLLTWDAVENAEGYVVTLWRQSADEETLALKIEKAAEKPVGTVTQYDCKDVLAGLEEGVYYATVTAMVDGAYAAPALAYVEDNVAGYQNPYDRMKAVENVRWEGTKLCWTGKTYRGWDETNGWQTYPVSMYSVNLYLVEDGEYTPYQTFEVAGSVTMVDLERVFAVGKSYAAEIIAHSDLDMLVACGLTDSVPSARAGYTGESGTPETPGDDHDGTWVAITSAEQWLELANVKDVPSDGSGSDSLQKIEWGKKYYLANDIDFSKLTAAQQNESKSIGNVTNRFMGTLDGNGHKITGLTLSNSDSGLFWYVGATGYIYDLTIDSANVLFSDNAAVLVHNNYGTVERCAVLNTNISADTGAVLGGMVSRNYGIIRDSYVQGGTLTSNSNTATGHGGFVGANEKGGLIERCWTSMDISTRSVYAGGFVGLGYGGTIRDCFALGSVSARGYSGGFIGRYVYGDNVTENCYAAGVVTVTGEEGNGFNGGNEPGSSFQYEQTQGTANCWYNSANGSAENYGAEAKALDDMATESFLTALNKTGAWERSDGKNNGLPYLKDVDAPETAEAEKITVEIAVATYDKSSYAFAQMGETISVTLDSTGNTRLVDVMDAAQAQELLTYAYATTSTYGRFIHTINGYAVDAPDGWMFTINDALSNVSASLATVKDGDKVLWFEGTTENLFRGPKWDELGDDKLEWEEISTVEQLVELAASKDAETLGKNYRLTADLDLREAVEFKGIGSADAPFTGRFDGQGHTISHVTISGTDGVGFFGVIKGATIKNLTLTDVSITGKTKVGGLVGEAQAVLGKNDPSENVANLIGACTVSGSVTGESAVGGLVGLNDGGYDDKTLFSVASAVNNCHADVTVTGTGSGSDANNKLGGLVGDNSGVVTASSASGSVTGGKMVGGLAGSNSGSIYDSHAAGNVSGENNVGGFVGSSTGTVKSCYSTGNVTGADYTGSFAGSISSAETAVGAGQVTVNGAGGYVGGFAGNLGGTITGLASQITVKTVYGNCIQPEGKTLSAVGNTNAFTTDGQKEALAEMQLTDWDKVNDKLLELFGVSLPGIGEALEQFNDIAIPYGAKQGEAFRLYTGEVAGEITVTVAENDYIQAGNDKGTVALKKAHDEADGAAVAVTVTLTESGRTVSKTVTVTLLRQTEAVMHAIAATLTGTKDDWAAMDMAAYAALGSGSSRLTDAARQNVIDLLINKAAEDTATASYRSRIELVLRALGVDTTRLYPVNSNTPLDNAAKLRAMVDSISEYDYYTAPYVLLANMQGNVKLTSAQVEKLVRIMADNLGEGDIYTWSYGDQSGVDYDTTATALAAVQPYVGSSAAAKALSDRLLAALKKGIQSGTNANSDAMIIIGLVAAGVDPETVKCADGSSIVTDLLRYVNSTGDGFLYFGAENALATEQGFRALVALAKFKATGKAYNVYDFSTVKTQPAHAAGTGEAEKPKDPEETEDKITVTVTISTPSGTWLSKSVKLNKGSTVYHAFTKALEGSGVTQVGAENGYVRSISKGGVTYGEFTSGPNSGWLYKVNGVLPSVPLTQMAVDNGDYVLWYYTTDWKSDPDAGKMAEEELTAADVIKLIDAIGTVTKSSGNAIAAARSAYNKLSDAEKALVTNYDKLLAAEAAYAELVKAQQEETKTESVTGWQKQYKDALDEVKSDELTFGSEWLVIALARSGRDVPDSYYDSVVKAVQDAGGVLSDKKFTEYSRTILALTAIGKDPTNVGGYDLLSKLADMDDVTYQGLNGAIFALLALDSSKYDVPAAAEGGKQVTRDGLVAYILEQQLADGGWALSGESADPDMTAMALQALAAYRTGDTAVQTAVDKALKTLSDMQQADGGYSSWGTLNSESCAQVIIALTALGIDPAKDSRFAKNGLTVLDALLAFALDGGFRHTADGKADAMATEQALCALTAYARLLDGKTALYDMTDVLGGQTAADEPDDDSTPDETPKKGVGVVVWIVLGVAAVGGCTALAVTRRRRDE